MQRAALVVLIAVACTPRTEATVEVAGVRLVLPEGVEASDVVPPVCSGGELVFVDAQAPERGVCYGVQPMRCVDLQALFAADREAGGDVDELVLGARSWYRRNVGSGITYEHCASDRTLHVTAFLPIDHLLDPAHPEARAVDHPKARAFLGRVEDSLARTAAPPP
jgi:hypothetical protein